MKWRAACWIIWQLLIEKRLFVIFWQKEGFHSLFCRMKGNLKMGKYGDEITFAVNDAHCVFGFYVPPNMMSNIATKVNEQRIKGGVRWIL